MNSTKIFKRGALLLIVIMTIVIAIILTNVILNIMLSQGRLSKYEISRIQAKYASMAGVNWAYENLRRGNWSKPAAGNCDHRTLNDSAFPPSINSIDVYVASPGTSCFAGADPCTPPAGAEVCINAITDYTYTP